MIVSVCREKIERGIAKQRERKRERMCVYVFLSVFVKKKNRQRQRVFVCMYVCGGEGGGRESIVKNSAEMQLLLNF